MPKTSREPSGRVVNRGEPESPLDTYTFFSSPRVAPHQTPSLYEMSSQLAIHRAGAAPVTAMLTSPGPRVKDGRCSFVWKTLSKSATSLHSAR